VSLQSSVLNGKRSHWCRP